MSTVSVRVQNAARETARAVDAGDVVRLRPRDQAVRRVAGERVRVADEGLCWTCARLVPQPRPLTVNHSERYGLQH